MGRLTRLSADEPRPTLAAISAALHNVVSWAELRAERLSPDQIGHLVAIGFLYPKHRGVYAVGRPELSFEGRCRAAWLACGGEGSAVSHISGASVHNFRSSTGRIHVSGPRSLEGHPDIWVHRPRSLPPEDIVDRDGYAVTTVARTILDMAPGQSVDTIGRWIHEACIQGVFDARELWACLERRPGQRARRKIEAALALEVRPTRSELERAMWRLWRSADMPPADANVHVPTTAGLEEVDGFCPSLNLVVEVDGDIVHGTRWRKRRDAAKDERMRAAGRVVERVPELALTLDPEGVTARFRQLAAALGPSWSAEGPVRRPTA